jgi:hypothetical protein
VTSNTVCAKGLHWWTSSASKGSREPTLAAKGHVHAAKANGLQLGIATATHRLVVWPQYYPQAAQASLSAGCCAASKLQPAARHAHNSVDAARWFGTRCIFYYQRLLDWAPIRGQSHIPISPFSQSRNFLLWGSGLSGLLSTPVIDAHSQTACVSAR